MKSPYKFIITVIAVIAVTGVIAAVYMYNLKDRNLQNAKPDYIVTATELQKAFSDDETAASSLYINKIIEVTGIVESTKAGEDNTLTVSLSTDNSFSVVLCTFQPEAAPQGLQAGEEVTLRGECSGFLMDVLLNNCSVVK